MREFAQTLRQTYQQQLCIEVTIEKLSASRQRHARAMVTSHAINSDSDHVEL